MSILSQLPVWGYFFPFLAIGLGAVWRVLLGHEFADPRFNRYTPRGVRVAVGTVVALGISYLALGPTYLAVIVAAGGVVPLIMKMGGWNEFYSLRQSWITTVAAIVYVTLGGSWIMASVWAVSCLMARAYFPIKTEIYRGQSEPPWVHKLGEALLGGSHIGLIAIL